MAHPSDQESIAHLRGSAAEALVHKKDNVLITWEKLVRKSVTWAKGLSQPILIDTLPVFLANLAQALAENHPRGLATESNNVAQEHGGERARFTRYGPDQIIEEYKILRKVVEAKIEEDVPLSNEDRTVIQKSFDQAIQDAMTAYFLVHGRIRDQFVATLSHDLRNPLGAARMAADIIQNEFGEMGNASERADLKNLTKRIVENVKRADRMIQNLLDTNHMQLGERIQLNLEACDMLSIVEAVRNELSDEDGKRFRIIGENAKGHWDREGVLRALENLVSNAYKYGADDSKVTVKIYEKLGRVVVSVHNEGTPIPVEEQELLFQAFCRSEVAKASGKKGWGIGLALARGVAESHGGSLGVDSSKESGTTFAIDIPADSRPFQ